MSHYTDQNPISEQAWMESVLNQLGGKPTQHSKPGELSELAEAISEINGILAKNNNNPPSDPAVLEDFAEKLDELSLMIYSLLEADEADEDDGSKDKKKQWPVIIKVSKPSGKRKPLKGILNLMRAERQKRIMARQARMMRQNKMQPVPDKKVLAKKERIPLNLTVKNYTDQNPISEQAWMDSVLNQLGCKATQHKLQKENFTGEVKNLFLYAGKEKEVMDNFNKIRSKEHPYQELHDDYIIFRIAFERVHGKKPGYGDKNRFLSAGKEKAIIDKFNELSPKIRNNSIHGSSNGTDDEHYENYRIFNIAFRQITGHRPENEQMVIELKMSGDTLEDFVIHGD